MLLILLSDKKKQVIICYIPIYILFTCKSQKEDISKHVFISMIIKYLCIICITNNV